jgi:hypothetical protein
MFGIGYKAGNGVGFLGADLIVNPIPHLGFDLQASFEPMSVTTIGPGASTTESGLLWAIVPAVTGYLFPRGSTPYLSAGMVYAHLGLETASATVTGTFANIGYEWKWKSGLGLQLGGGVGYITHGEAMSGNATIEVGGKLNPNLEIGLRYMFL